MLDLNDNQKNAIDWDPGDDQMWNLVRGPPQEASGAMDRPIEEQGERPKWGKILDIPLKTPGGTKDDNGNVLLLSDFLHYP